MLEMNVSSHYSDSLSVTDGIDEDSLDSSGYSETVEEKKNYWQVVSEGGMEQENSVG